MRSCLSAICIEVDFPRSSTRTCWEAFGNDGRLLGLSNVEDRCEECVKLISRVAHDCGFPIDEFFFHHVCSKLQSGSCGAFAVTCLKHEKLPFLDGKLDVLNIFEMGFKDLTNFHQFLECSWKCFSHSCNCVWSANTSNHVFALSVDEELTVKNVFTVRRVTCESNAGTRVGTCVTEDHGLNVNGCAPCCRDTIFTAINDRSVIHP